MLKLHTTARFHKDYERIKRQGYRFSLPQDVLEKFCAQGILEMKYRNHALTDFYKGFRECHIAPDWFLIYAIGEDELVLVASRMGTHIDLPDRWNSKVPAYALVPPIISWF